MIPDSTRLGERRHALAANIAGMPRRLPFDRRLLGGLTPAAFLATHWQRKPLLIRGAVDDLRSLPDRMQLFELAARDDVESRLVTAFGGRWAMSHGPFDRMPKNKRDWTLLVQGVNLHDRHADALMRRFDFVSSMRLDDLMISHAVDGGGVGPHVDSYDVFLLQIEGTRRWRWRDRTSTSRRERALVEGVPLKLLEHFVPTDEAVLEPGDMLYLPPSCAHEGVAIGACTTASIGFRAPSWNALSQEFLFAMAERDWPDGRLVDAGRHATDTPASIDRTMLDAVVSKLDAIRFTTRDIEAFVGRHFSEPKAHVYFEPPRPTTLKVFMRRALQSGLRLDLRTTVLYRGKRGYIAGEDFALPTTGTALFRQLADRRRLGPAMVVSIIEDPGACALLHAWWQHGWILFDDGEPDGTS
jgi:50S ribosomal protein L16 3-hydroxylase